MTKLIGALIVAVCLFVAWRLFVYWDEVQNEKENEKRQTAAAVVRGDQLEGMPWQLQHSLDAATKLGPAGLKNWLKLYGPSVQDPRKAWIELDYCAMIARDNTAEAKRIFADVKARTPHSSKVWPRIQQLAKTYD